MENTGKKLENLVAQIEKLLLPENFTVTANERVFNDKGIQIAEFDIKINGRLGSTDIKWLIECRDRPTDGHAPASWVEQLVGRRDRFSFNKITAVSTTGFSQGAIEYAKKSGIEIRTVKEISFDDISNWFQMTHVTLINRICNLKNAMLLIEQDTSEIIRQSLKEVLVNQGPNAPILISTGTGEAVRPMDAFQAVVSENAKLYDDIEANSGSKKVKIKAIYQNDDSHFIVRTSKGDVRIREILFEGTLKVAINEIPINGITKYSKDIENEAIAHSVSFRLNIGNENVGLEFHKLAHTGETHVLLRKGK